VTGPGGRFGHGEQVALASSHCRVGGTVLPRRGDERGVGAGEEREACGGNRTVGCVAEGGDAPHVEPVATGQAGQPLRRVEATRHVLARRARDSDETDAVLRQSGAGVGTRAVEEATDVPGENRVVGDAVRERASQRAGLTTNDPVCRPAGSRGHEDRAVGQLSGSLFDRDGRPWVRPRAQGVAEAEPAQGSGTDQGDETERCHADHTEAVTQLVEADHCRREEGQAQGKHERARPRCDDTRPGHGRRCRGGGGEADVW